MKAVTSLQNLTPTVTTIDVQNDQEVVAVTENDEETLTEDENWKSFP